MSGDVVVGWVNARTGKGEIDDYFLAGNNLKCDDGAESCPDISKPVNPIDRLTDKPINFISTIIL